MSGGRSGVFSLLVAALLTAAPFAAFAAERIAVRIGMSMADIEAYLKEECADLVIGGQAEKYITCQLKDGNLITANLSPRDRITYSVYREKSDLPNARAFAAEVAAELGFEGQGEGCMSHSDPSLCWSKATAELKVYLSPDSEGRLVAIQSDEAMRREDE